jgi:hypothetical protein
MLADVTERDIAKSENYYMKDHPDILDEDVLFTDTYERIGKGLYYTSFDFRMLGENIIKNEYWFQTELRSLWQEAFKLNDEGKHEEGQVFSKQAMSLMEDFADYGVCDYPEQVVEAFPKLESDARRFLISFNLVRYADQGEQGWRWHKNGPYIGTRNPQGEYLAEEAPGFGDVYMFHIYELHAE